MEREVILTGVPQAAEARAEIHSSRPLKIRNFHYDVSFDNYIQALSKAAKIKRCSDQELVKVCKDVLILNGEEFVDTNTGSKVEDLSFIELMDALIARFGNGKSFRYYGYFLEEIFQRDGETVDEFARRCLEMGKKLTRTDLEGNYAEAWKIGVELILKNAFLSGVQLGLGKHLKRINPGTFAEAVAMALTIEQAHHQECRSSSARRPEEELEDTSSDDGEKHHDEEYELVVADEKNEERNDHDGRSSPAPQPEHLQHICGTCGGTLDFAVSSTSQESLNDDTVECDIRVGDEGQPSGYRTVRVRIIRPPCRWCGHRDHPAFHCKKRPQQFSAVPTQELPPMRPFRPIMIPPVRPRRYFPLPTWSPHGPLHAQANWTPRLMMPIPPQIHRRIYISPPIFPPMNRPPTFLRAQRMTPPDQ